ncbi:DUF58 domain-containing protein [Thalassotalea ponticola]|uniref:DUF58 domain-containing protein n=1 Tax=Thalassotalea ponticola TaxID=1523392 RepID=UPI0025B40411|nr:DUF58 domain-containing protein [Thalassotalea ponticola]MDN3651645.1 DUF58 domain-containing protein [Thalassotalea ponticola]
MWWKKSDTTSFEQDAKHRLELLGGDGIHLSIDQLLAYRSKVSLINLAPRKNVQSHLSGNYLARSKGRGMEFDEVRHYQAGDDIRAIDWRVTARTGKTHTKLFKEEVERPVLIAVDLGQTMYFGSELMFKSVQACHLGALIAWHANSRGDRVGGLVFHEQNHVELKPQSRQHGVLHYLHALDELHQQGLDLWHHKPAYQQQYFIDNINRLCQLAKPGALVYVITDGYHVNDDVMLALRNINQHCELVVCHVDDPLEHRLPAVGQKSSVMITDGEHSQPLLLGDKTIAQQYKQRATDIHKQKRAYYQRAGARVTHISANELLEQQLKQGLETWIR